MFKLIDIYVEDNKDMIMSNIMPCLVHLVYFCNFVTNLSKHVRWASVIVIRLAWCSFVMRTSLVANAYYIIPQIAQCHYRTLTS